VQDTYDKVVSNTLQLLRGVSLDERASKLNEQFKRTEVEYLVITTGICFFLFIPTCEGY
jgi:hypothetical protein